MKQRKHMYMILAGSNLHIQMDRHDGVTIHRKIAWEAVKHARIDLVDINLDDMERELDAAPPRPFVRTDGN